MAVAFKPAKEDEGYSVSELRRQFLDFQGTKSAEIKEQKEARHYYHGDQWTSGELQKLKERNQPPVTANSVGRKIDGIVGLVERLRQDPKAYARTPEEEQRGGAETATAAIRYTLDANDWQPNSSEAARSAGINGIGGIELSLEKGDHDDPEVSMALVDAETYFYDPRSARLDFSDKRFDGVAKWVDLDLAKEMFPDKADELDSIVDSGGVESTMLEDRSKHWVDTQKKRVFLVEHWYLRRGQWRFCFYVADLELKSGVSPFTDEKGKSMSRFIMFSANVDHDGDRYGFVRNLKSLQDEKNARRSKALHNLNMRRIVMENGAVDDVERTRKEAIRPDGVIVKNRGYEFEFDDQRQLADMQGQLEFLKETKEEIENFGFNPALIGTGVQDMSGRAIQLQQQAGIAELGPFIIAYRSWKIRVYRAVWNIVQEYWTSERWIRVTDNDGVAQFLQLNALQLDPHTGQMIMANHLGSLDVDIILDEGPDTITMAQDTYDTMTALAGKGMQFPPEALMELAPIDSRTKKRVLEALQKSQQAGPAQQIQVAAATAKIEETRANTALKQAQTVKTAEEARLAPLQAQHEIAKDFADRVERAGSEDAGRRERFTMKGVDLADRQQDRSARQTEPA